MDNNDEKTHSSGKDAEAGIITDDIEVAESHVRRYGEVRRGLNSRQVQFMAIGGTIGTGLFVGIGSALTRAGPLSMLLGYSITGLGVFGMMQCLGEMVTFLPLPGAIPQFGARFVDDALGFTLGWNNWYSGALAVCTDVAAGAVIIQYWDTATTPAAWITLFIGLLTILNVIAVEIFGEVEFFFSTMKIVAMVGLLIMSVVLTLGGGPNHDRIGFRYWKNPGAMKEYLVPGDTGRFLGLFSTLITASFSYGGIEAVAIMAGETSNPRKNMPKAIRRLFWRIIFFYVLGSLALGVLIPYNDPNLVLAQQQSREGAAGSPWVIAIQNAGISGLPSVINAVILMSAISASNQFVYITSRYLYALATIRQAPSFFLTCSKRGIPYYAVGITCLMMALSYLSVDSRGLTVFTWLSNLTVTSAFLNWGSICYSYIRFYHALKAQGIDRNTLAFKSPFQPYLSYVCLGFWVIVTICCGFSVFIHGHWSYQGFLTYYLNIPVFVILFLGYKIVKRTKFHRSEDVDLKTGRHRADMEELEYVEDEPKNIFVKIWRWIA